MVDLRFYIVSMVVIFLAMGLGILIGGTTLNNDALSSQQSHLIDSLQRDFNEIKKQNKALETQLEAERKFGSQVLAALAKNKLRGKRIGLVELGENKDTLNDVQDAIKLAGGTIEFQINVNRNEPRLPEGLEIHPIDAVVFIASESASANHMKPELIRFILDYGIRVVTVESTKLNSGSLSAFRKLDLPTVDHVDTLPGKLSLIYALMGTDGHFGVKAGATSLMPDVLKEREENKW